MSEILKETTNWPDYDCNHTYLLDNKGYIVAYAKNHTNDIDILTSKIRLDKRRRTFVKSNHNELSKLLKNDVPEKGTRVFKVKSKANEYMVESTGYKYSCTCTGYNFRGKCKHIDAVKKQTLISQQILTIGA